MQAGTVSWLTPAPQRLLAVSLTNLYNCAPSGGAQERHRVTRIMHKIPFDAGVACVTPDVAANKKRILIVEDHVDLRRLIHLTLEAEDLEIHEAANGPDGLALARCIRPDLVLMDVMMPGEFDGLEACRRLKQDAQLSQVPVVMLTARGQVRDREAGLQAGADVYLVKPFSPMQLLEKVEQLLSAG